MCDFVINMDYTDNIGLSAFLEDAKDLGQNQILRILYFIMKCGIFIIIFVI